MYWQRQGLCSLILVQQSLVGGEEDVIALTQELSWVGVQVTAIETSASARRSTRRVKTEMCFAFIWYLL